VQHVTPSSKWVVDYGKDSCTLARSFGEGDDKVLLILRQFVPGDGFETSLVGKRVKPVSSSWPVKATLRFGPGEGEASAEGLTGTLNDLPSLIFHGNQSVAALTPQEEAALEAAAKRHVPFELQPIGAAREKAVRWLRIGRALRSDLVLETGPMDKPLAALRKCSWDTVKSWGLDVEEQQRLTRQPFPTQPLMKWFSADDYPDEMVRQGRQAIVHFRVIVDEAGQVASCHIQISTKPKAFDDVVCAKVKKRASFHPALDARGRPVRSYWRQTVIFRMEP
jgi:TonB family protein